MVSTRSRKSIINDSSVSASISNDAITENTKRSRCRSKSKSASKSRSRSRNKVIINKETKTDVDLVQQQYQQQQLEVNQLLIVNSIATHKSTIAALSVVISVKKLLLLLIRYVTPVIFIYIFTIVVHYSSVHLYMKYCVPDSIWTFALNGFVATSGQCEILRYIMFQSAFKMSSITRIFQEFIGYSFNSLRHSDMIGNCMS